MKARILKLFLPLLLLPYWANGLHLVGGEMYYDCLGSNLYEITLFVYRDCNSSGAPFDPSAVVTIYKGDGTFFNNYYVPFTSTANIPTTINNPCLSAPPNICTEYAVYKLQVTLTPDPNGYVITHQRCCRNSTIDNITSPNTYGNTYTIQIPPNDIACNSSPRFAGRPPIVLCLNEPLNLPLTATDPDGDSLFYELCDPLNGGGQNGNLGAGNSPAPDPALAPPYSTVPFSTGFSATYPLSSNPALALDPNSGVLTGTPDVQGIFVISICVSEYRNGQLLSTLRRDYQFTVSPCIINTASAINAQINLPNTYCSGRTITFQNLSTSATTYHWDFGVAGTLADTSNAQNPTFTFPDTGVYMITLIANPGFPCADTTTSIFEVYENLDPSFSFVGDLCLDVNAIYFSPDDTHPPGSVYQWDFGPDANIQTYTGRIPPPITFNSLGPHEVRLTIDFNLCNAESVDSVLLYERPILDFEPSQTTGCVPFTVDISDFSTSSTPANIYWNFGDGGFFDTISTYTYTQPGTYTITGRLETTTGCKDTQIVAYPTPIVVNPTPSAAVSVSPLITDIYEAQVDIINLSPPGYTRLEIHTGDGRIYENLETIKHTYQDTGTFRVDLVVINDFNCSDTASAEVWIQPLSQIFVPSAFSPDGDGLNEEFRPIVTGYEEYELVVLNRWGQRVFMTTDPYIGWNGTLENVGEQMAIGVYTYIVNVIDQNYELRQKQGTVLLMR